MSKFTDEQVKQLKTIVDESVQASEKRMVDCIDANIDSAIKSSESKMHKKIDGMGKSITWNTVAIFELKEMIYQNDLKYTKRHSELMNVVDTFVWICDDNRSELKIGWYQIDKNSKRIDDLEDRITLLEAA